MGFVLPIPTKLDHFYNVDTVIGLPPRSDCYATLRETRTSTEYEFASSASAVSREPSPNWFRCFRWTSTLSNESNHELAYTRHPRSQKTRHVLCVGQHVDNRVMLGIGSAPTHLRKFRTLSVIWCCCQFSLSRQRDPMRSENWSRLNLLSCEHIGFTI